jgi:hypothetical protein
MSRSRQYVLAVLSPLAVAAVICGALYFLSGGRLLPAALIGGPTLVSVDRSPKEAFSAREGDVVTAEFTVKNITDRPLRLLGANTSCGCAIVASEFPVELAPAASTVVKFEVHVDKPQSNGMFQQQAQLLVNREGTVPPMVIEAAIAH